MKAEIDHFMKILPQLTKDEADLIQEVLTWEDEKKAAFLLAKRLFDDAVGDTDQDSKRGEL